jgi:hypothetical protein
VAMLSREQQRLLAMLGPSMLADALLGRTSGTMEGGRSTPEQNRWLQAQAFGRAADDVRVGIVNGAAGLVAYAANGDPFAVLAITVRDRLIVEFDILADRERLRSLVVGSRVDDGS